MSDDLRDIDWSTAFLDDVDLSHLSPREQLLQHEAELQEVNSDVREAFLREEAARLGVTWPLSEAAEAA